MRLFLCGDVMLGRGIDQILPDPCPPGLHEAFVVSARTYVELAESAHGPINWPVDLRYVWGDALPELERRRPDARIVNLETAITRSDDWQPKGINYRVSPENARSLRAARIDCCVLANNHVLDWGGAGLSETLSTLDSLQIGHAGAGNDAAQARAPAVLDLGAKGRVLVFSFATETSGVPPDWAAGAGKAGVNLLPDLSDAMADRVLGQIEGLARPNDIVVASIHWGANWGYGIPADQQRFARRLVDGGVSIVHGHSSHHPRAIETYRQRLILHGCGDFVNDYEGISGKEQYRADLALMYLPELDTRDGRLLSLTLVPLRLRNFRLQHASPADAGWLAQMLDRESRKYGTSVAPGTDGALTCGDGRRSGRT
ncbi:MAG: CapA family protein [Proteobacteria bacterium]|nr:CapA family protein [Pseudomonadota bacterium]